MAAGPGRRVGDAVLELGAGSGQLLIDFLTECARRDCLPARYLVLEISPALRSRQQARVSAELPSHLAERVTWIADRAELAPGEALHWSARYGDRQRGTGRHAGRAIPLGAR
ncbi:hypothetical protein A9404_00010 [Halothiobacillus diazotrophicus]|uniref:Uncharacterized protein n=1 Tax=Halothiobacillus diazotrophicus TaxID=1860122 RepID=A0A191ZJV1_9GAMM|nr:SAM-dependent methyltransferase [Halothiobacillus diazotrophicus]ANJ68164.1 hypothetical protein A9404_00010 [Halothiobacillus diazotrophicus]